MQNVEMTLSKDGILTIKIDTKKNLGPSASGKTIMVASTKGNVAVPGKEEVKIGINCYKYPESK
jgi:hypothetical protein